MATPRYVVKRIGNDYKIIRSDTEGVVLSSVATLAGGALVLSGLRSGGVALEKSACRPRSDHAHEGASIHSIPWPKIVLANHGSSPLRKVGVGYWESLSWLLGTFEFVKFDCRPPVASPFDDWSFGK